MRTNVFKYIKKVEKLFLLISEDGIRSSRHTLEQGIFRLDIRKSFPNVG